MSFLRIVWQPWVKGLLRECGHLTNRYTAEEMSLPSSSTTHAHRSWGNTWQRHPKEENICFGSVHHDTDMEISLPFQVAAAGAQFMVDQEAESVRTKVGGTIKGLSLVACFSQPCPIS